MGGQTDNLNRRKQPPARGYSSGVEHFAHIKDVPSSNLGIRTMKNITYLILMLLIMVSCGKSTKEVSDTFTYSHDIESSRYIPIVKGTLNGKVAYFILDTGATVSIFDEKEARKYGVVMNTNSNTSIGGYGGVTTEAYEVSNYEIQLGKLKIKDRFLGRDITDIINAVHNNTGYKAVGIIGQNNIYPNKLILDFQTSTIVKR